MVEDTLGILLSKREWNKLKHTKLDHKNCFYHYAKKAEELNLEVVFIPINNISIIEGKTEAIIVKNNTITHEGMVKIPSIIYNPTKFNLKKNIKTIRELSQNPNIHVINEHHVLKDKNVFEIIQSRLELQKYVKKELKQVGASFTFYLLGQKNTDQQWKVSFLFAKDADNRKHSIEEVYQLYDNNSERKNVDDSMIKISEKILSIIHFYYPGLYEIGMHFIVNQDGELTLKSFCTKKSIEKELFEWDEELWETTVKWPIELALEIKRNIEYSRAINNPTEDEIDEFQSDLNLKEPDRHVWVKFKPFKNNEMMIKVPRGILGHKLIKSYDVQFGVKTEKTRVYFINQETEFLQNNSYEYPIDVFVSTSLVEKMRIPLNLVYQLNISHEKIIIGPTIGFILGEKNQLYNPEYMKKFSDRFGEYEKFGGLAIAFSTRSIDWNDNIVYGMIYDPEQKKWIYNSSPIPSSLYRRNFHQNEKSINQLIKITKKQLFNSHHFKKSDLYELQKDPQIKDHLPDTHLLKSMDQLIEFINVNKKVILKPVSLSRGRGIFILEKNKEKKEAFILYDYRKKYRVRHLLNDAIALIEMLESLDILKQKYLYQTYIPLLKINERPFDVRVVMQKYNINKWECTGIECRVAGENEDLTNIARGGKAMTLEAVIQESGKNLSYSKTNKNILLVCQKFCDLMDRTGEHYAEFGLDIALDEKGYPWLLEANIFPSFKGFKDIDYERYLKIRSQPLFYAVQLQGFNALKEESVFDEVYNQKQSYL